MQALFAFIWFELKLYVRAFVPLFFNIVLPVAAFGFAGAAHLDEGPAGVARFFESHTSAFVVILSISVGLLNVANSLVLYRELGIFKRLLTTPLDPSVFVVSAIVRGLVVILTAVLLMLLVSYAMSGEMPVSHPFEFGVTALTAACALFAGSYVFGSFFKDQKTVFPLSAIFFYILWFVSGAFPVASATPYQGWFYTFSPSFYALEFVKLGWAGKLFSADAMLPFVVLLAMTVGFVLIARKRLSWTL